MDVYHDSETYDDIRRSSVAQKNRTCNNKENMREGAEPWMSLHNGSNEMDPHGSTRGNSRPHTAPHHGEKNCLGSTSQFG